MSILSYLLLFLLSAQVALGYTVVLTSGKRIEGTLISDQAFTIVIRDSKGVLISFKKNSLDWTSMNAINSAQPVQVSNETPKPSRKPRGLAEIAWETKRERTGKARNVNLEELKDAASVSILGTHETPNIAEEAREHSSVSERQWESRLWTMKKEINRLREKRVEAETACEESRQKQYAARTTPSRKPVELLSTYKEPSACRRLTEIDAQLQQAEMRLEDAREEARRSGVSWQTLE